MVLLSHSACSCTIKYEYSSLRKGYRMLTIIIILAAYLIGSIPSGLIIGKTFYNIDIREHGSKNLGGTNTFRTLGVKAGLTVTIMDILKGTLATLLPFFLGADMPELLAGICAVIGHMFPIFANFRGGKSSCNISWCHTGL